jgi:ketosteroid isomerase-like protein
MVVVSQTERTQATAVEDVLRAEREQREAYLQRDIAKIERLVANEFVLTSHRNIGDKSTLLNYLKSAPLDPTLTLTTEDTHVKVNGDTAIVFGRRVERRRREDNKREGVAYARYMRTYIKRQGRWQLLAEHLETIPAERTAIKVDAKVYDDYVGEYESLIFDFAVVKEGERLMAVPKERYATRTSQGRPPGMNPALLRLIGTILNLHRVADLGMPWLGPLLLVLGAVFGILASKGQR